MESTKAWLEKIGKTIDAKDSEGFADFLTEDGIFRFGNQPDVKGRKAVAGYVAQFFTMIKSSEHEIVNFWEKDNAVIWQGRVHYTKA
ncbi:MAG TPA: nuclear transport factor 2 family protein [Ignavibacteria bacterium]|jgi:ketosteroid isomerase-like protein